MKESLSYHAYIIGFQKNGGAQLSFFREALMHSKISPNSKIYFFASGDLSAFDQSLIPINFKIIEHKSNIKFNIFRLIQYSYFLYLNLKSLKKISKNITISYTTPAISVISATLGILLLIKKRRYRVGGLLFSLNYRSISDFVNSISGFFIDLYITFLSCSITFVCNPNKQFYKNLFFHIRYKKLSVIHSPCCDKSILKFSPEFEKFESHFVNFKNLKFSEKKIILTLVNDKERKGFPIFYKLAKNLSYRKDLLFVHVGSRLISQPNFLDDNLLVIPHSNKIADWIKLADITTLFSTYPEGLPQVIVQSLSFSVPVLTFQHNGLNDVVLDGFNGRVLNNKSSIKYISKSLLGMLDEDKFKEYNSNCKYISNFIYRRHSLSTMESKLSKLLDLF